MQQPIIPFSALTIPQLLETHNALARPRGEPPLKRWHGSRCRLVQRVAILRTRQPISPSASTSPRKTKRKTPVRDAIMEALAFVAYYEDANGKRVSKSAALLYPTGKLRSVGLSYDEVLRRVQRKIPTSKVSLGQLRWVAHMVRNRAPGFEKCILPSRRKRRY